MYNQILDLDAYLLAARAVPDSMAALQCDSCDRQLHRKCKLRSLGAYRHLSRHDEGWLSCACQLPLLDNTLLESPYLRAPTRLLFQATFCHLRSLAPTLTEFPW